MARINRSSIFPKAVTYITHAIAKTAQDIFLMGNDPVTKKDYSHRKEWIAEIMRFQASLMAIDVLGYAIMSNHVHFMLRSRPDIVAKWTDYEVARRWLTLCPKHRRRKRVNGKLVYTPVPPTEEQIEAVVKDPERIKELRAQLCDVSWWMRLLCQKVAQRANSEEGVAKGHFWKSRFHAVVIEEYSYLVACTAYVDLNPQRANIAKSIEDYDYTSAKARLHKNRGDPSWLSPIQITSPSSNPEVSTQGARCSDKGFLEMSEQEYFELLKWCIEHQVATKDIEVKADRPPWLCKLGVSMETWVKQVRSFGKLYRYFAGTKPTATEGSPQSETHGSGSTEGN